MNHVCSYDPAPGTERVHCLTCQICGARHMNRTGLCNRCMVECMEIGRGIKLLKEGDIVIGEQHQRSMSDRLAPWVIGTAVVYFGIHIIVAISKGWL